VSVKKLYSMAVEIGTSCPEGISGGAAAGTLETSDNGITDITHPIVVSYIVRAAMALDEAATSYPKRMLATASVKVISAKMKCAGLAMPIEPR